MTRVSITTAGFLFWAAPPMQPVVTREYSSSDYLLFMIALNPEKLLGLHAPQVRGVPTLPEGRPDWTSLAEKPPQSCVQQS